MKHFSQDIVNNIKNFSNNVKIGKVKVSGDIEAEAEKLLFLAENLPEDEDKQETIKTAKANITNLSKL